MDLLALLNSLVSKLAELQQALADAQAAADSVAKVAYDSGFAAGVASVVIPPSDKIFSQAELDAVVNPLKDQVASLQKSLDDLTLSVSAQIEAAVSLAKAELKASLLLTVKALLKSEEVDLEGKLDSL